MEKTQQQLDIDISSDVATGTYSNLAIISHSPTEFTLDFAQMLPGVNKAIVRQRIVMAPAHLKRLFHAIEDNILRYEGSFGEITDPSAAMSRNDDTIDYPLTPMGNA